MIPVPAAQAAPANAVIIGRASPRARLRRAAPFSKLRAAAVLPARRPGLRFRGICADRYVE